MEKALEVLLKVKSNLDISNFYAIILTRTDVILQGRPDSRIISDVMSILDSKRDINDTHSASYTSDKFDLPVTFVFL